MLTPEVRKDMERQQYRIIGSHSAVKICGWTKSFLRGRGFCYKQKFYGIQSVQCLQMTTSISCANRCVFCWRDYKAPVSREWKWEIDEPDFIIDNAMDQHHDLLMGFKGNDNADMNAYRKSREIKHVALSLTGEPIIYPKINELVASFNRRGISTFLVTNAQYPEHIRDLSPVTQLYLSLDAAEKELLKKIDLPLFPDFWERLNRSLEYLSQKKQRTCIRLTLIKGLNMADPEGYARLIMKGDPDFVEVKAYMYIGASTKRLERGTMPLHAEVMEFAKELAGHLPDYEIVSDHRLSRVVMLAKKGFRRGSSWMTWIDFEKYNKLALSGKEFGSEDYLKPMPEEFLLKAGK